MTAAARLASTALCAALLLQAAVPAAAAPRGARKPLPEISGTVSRVVDGDTVWLAREGASEPLVVRIEGIDAPERCQTWGAQATQALNELALHKTVRLRLSAHDDWGRSVGRLYDGRVDIGDRMVRDGHAWSTRYRYDRGPYVAEERMALALRRGLHAAGDALEPRAFRKRHGPCEAQGAASAAAP